MRKQLEAAALQSPPAAELFLCFVEKEPKFLETQLFVLECKDKNVVSVSGLKPL